MESLLLVTTLRVCIRRRRRPLLFLSSRKQVKQRMVKKRPNHVLLRQMKDFTWGIFWIIQKNHCLKSCMQKMNFLLFLWRTQRTGYTLPFILSHLESQDTVLTLPQKEGATQRASPELPLGSGGQRLLPHPSFNLESHTHGSPKQMAAYIWPLHHQPEPMTWLQLPKLLQSWLPTWLHLMDAGDKPTIKHCWQAAVTGTFRGRLEGNQSRKKCNSKEKPLGQRNPRDIIETYFKVLREDWQKLLAITKKLMDIFKVSSKHILHIKHTFMSHPPHPN